MIRKQEQIPESQKALINELISEVVDRKRCLKRAVCLMLSKSSLSSKRLKQKWRSTLAIRNMPHSAQTAATHATAEGTKPSSLTTINWQSVHPEIDSGASIRR